MSFFVTELFLLIFASCTSITKNKFYSIFTSIFVLFCDYRFLLLISYLPSCLLDFLNVRKYFGLTTPSSRVNNKRRNNAEVQEKKQDI
jgi:hypothetical protein